MKRRRSSVGNFETLCVICQTQYCKKDIKLFRLCKVERATLFLSATRFSMDSVYTRTSVYENKEQLFAADILTHKQYTNRYVL